MNFWRRFVKHLTYFSWELLKLIVITGCIGAVVAFILLLFKWLPLVAAFTILTLLILMFVSLLAAYLDN